MKKCLSLPFIARLILGCIFIYAGLHKFVNPEPFEEALHTYKWLSDQMISLIALIFPWAQVILGGLLVSGYFLRYVASFASILLIMSIIMSVLSSSKGDCQACGFLSEMTSYKGGNPFILLTINYLLLALSGMIVLSGLFFPKKTRFSFSRQVVLPLSIFCIIFLFLTLFTFIGRRSYEGKYVSAASQERNQILDELRQPENLSLIGADIKTISNSNIEFPTNPDIRIYVMLTLQSLDCGSCAVEAAFLEYLNTKFWGRIYFFAVVRRIGRTAIDNFRREYSLRYAFIEHPALLGSSVFAKYKSLVTIISPDRRILRIDPIGFNVKKFQDEYETVLLGYLK